VASCYCHCK